MASRTVVSEKSVKRVWMRLPSSTSSRSLPLIKHPSQPIKSIAIKRAKTKLESHFFILHSILSENS